MDQCCRRSSPSIFSLNNRQTVLASNMQGAAGNLRPGMLFQGLPKASGKSFREMSRVARRLLVDMAGFLAVCNQAMQPGRFASHGKKYPRLATFLHTVGNPVSFAEATKLGSTKLIVAGVLI